MQSLPLTNILYYSGCSSPTPSDLLPAGSEVTFSNGEIPLTSVAFTTSKKVVGAKDSNNIATFKFTPKTSLSTIAGQIQIYTPKWFDSTSRAKYPFEEKGFECSCTRFGKITNQMRVTELSTKSWRITYNTLIGPVNAEITILCKYWRNPIVPKTDTGYRLVTKDSAGITIDVSVPFEIDTNAYTPF